MLVNKKKKKEKNINLPNFGLCCPGCYWVKLKVSEKKDKYVENEKQLWIIKVTELPNVSGALGTDTKGLILGVKDLEMKGWVESFKLQHY